MKWYDTEGTEESICAATLDKLINLKLTKVHKGACNTYIATFASYLNIFVEEDVPFPEKLARDLFLLNIQHDEYKATKNTLRINKSDLKTAYKEIKSLSTQFENGQANSTNRIRTLVNPPNKYKGKPIDEFGNFKNTGDFTAMSYEDKKAYWKVKDGWLKQKLIKSKSTPASSSNSVNRKLKQSMDALEQSLKPTANSDSTTQDPDISIFVDRSWSGCKRVL